MTMDVKNIAAQLKNKKKGYNGEIEAAHGKIVHVRDGHAEAEGQRLFIEENGDVLGPDGSVVGHVAPGKLTKGTRAAR